MSNKSYLGISGNKNIEVVKSPARSSSGSFLVSIDEYINYNDLNTVISDINALYDGRYNSKKLDSDIRTKLSSETSILILTPYTSALKELNDTVKRLKNLLEKTKKEFSNAEKSSPNGITAPKSTITELANKAIAGQFGNGTAREKAIKKWLKDQGYKYSDKEYQKIQNKINEILNANKQDTKVDVPTAATKVTKVTTAAAPITAKMEEITSASKTGSKLVKSISSAAKEDKVMKSLTNATNDKKHQEQLIADAKQKELEQKRLDEERLRNQQIEDQKKQEAMRNEQEERRINIEREEQLAKERAEKEAELQRHNEEKNSLAQENKDSASRQPNQNENKVTYTPKNNNSINNGVENNTGGASDTVKQQPVETPKVEKAPTINETPKTKEPIIIDDTDVTTTASTSKKGSNAIPIGLGLAAAGAATVAGVRYVKNKDKVDYEEDSYDENYDEDYDGNDNSADSNVDYSYKATSKNEINDVYENTESEPEIYKAGGINKLTLDDGDDINITDDYYDDDFNEELE